MELLAPGGSLQGVQAAVQQGANSVYLGYGNYNARRNAKNFSPDQAQEAVDYCHLRGVSVYLTLNTLLGQRELEKAQDQICHARDSGFDGVIVQDLGVASTLQQLAPGLPLHGSTQMTVHSLDGVKQLQELGFTRVVLSRELPRQALEYIATHSPIELETFIHGALCMSYSGQCYFSALLGQRSGNRGLCAQPCRLEYQWQTPGKAPGPKGTPLSLKDLSLAGHLQALKDMGIACLKIEGRMKRPEYVAIVTGIYAAALREGREPTPQESAQLEQAFSREGFTQGYFQDQRGPEMFGSRQAQPEPKELFAQAQASYENRDLNLPLTGQVKILASQPATLELWDQDGHCTTAEGPVPQTALHRALTSERVRDQLERTGGTPFAWEDLQITLDPDLSLPISALNQLRREALDQMAQERIRRPAPAVGQLSPLPQAVSSTGPTSSSGFTLEVHRPDQLTPELLAFPWEGIHLPLSFASQPQALQRALATGAKLSLLLPRITWDRERDQEKQACQLFQNLGIHQATVGTWDALHWAKDQGFSLVGDYGLGVYNDRCLLALKELGLSWAMPSFELKFPQIRDLQPYLPLELLAYGHLPLMLAQQEIIPPAQGKRGTAPGQKATLIDRKGVAFPVETLAGCRSEIRNSAPLYLADKREDWEKLGISYLRLVFSQESPEDCVQIIRAYHQGTPAQGGITRGLYYRGVE